MPENAFRRRRTREPKPTDRRAWKCDLPTALAHRFALSPRVPASDVAPSFLPASTLSRPDTLRCLAVEDARCFSTTSATQSSCVHPHHVRSRLRSRHSRAVDPRGGMAPRGLTGGPEGSRPPRPLRRIDLDTLRVPYCLAAWGHVRGRFAPTAPTNDRASGIPVTRPRSPSASLAFAGAASSPSFLLSKGRSGRKVRGRPRPPFCSTS